MPIKKKSLKLSPDVVYRKLSKNDGILLNLNTKNYYSLNETACHVVALLQRGCDEETLVKSLVSKFGAPLKDAKKDVNSILSLLKNDRII